MFNWTTSKPQTNYGIILDLDQTLVYSYEDEILLETGITTRPECFDIRKRVYKLFLLDVMEKNRGKGEQTEMWGIIRPHVKEFIKFCFSYFRVVAVWSAGRASYVEALVDLLFKDVQRPHIIFTYNDCEEHPDDENLVVKPITSMIEKTQAADYMTLQNTFVLDDTEYTFFFNRDNGILIPPFRPFPTPNGLRESDFALKRLQEWFESLDPNIEDIRMLDKNNIFTN